MTLITATYLQLHLQCFNYLFIFTGLDVFDHFGSDPVCLHTDSLAAGTEPAAPSHRWLPGRVLQSGGDRLNTCVKHSQFKRLQV